MVKVFVVKFVSTRGVLLSVFGGAPQVAQLDGTVAAPSDEENVIVCVPSVIANASAIARDVRPV
jgi:hypothetical protein